MLVINVGVQVRRSIAKQAENKEERFPKAIRNNLQTFSLIKSCVRLSNNLYNQLSARLGIAACSFRWKFVRSRLYLKKSANVSWLWVCNKFFASIVRAVLREMNFDIGDCRSWIIFCIFRQGLEISRSNWWLAQTLNDFNILLTVI